MYRWRRWVIWNVTVPPASTPPTVQPTATKVSALTPNSSVAIERRRPIGVSLALAFGWVLFALWWRVVLTVESTDFFLRALASLGVGMAVVFTASRWWVAHNERLARKGNRGLTSRYAVPSWTHDAIDRPVVMPSRSELADAAVITINAGGQTKRYDVESPRTPVPNSGSGAAT